MFERFTKDARRVVVLAQEEARDLRHSHIGTEHLLLGIAGEGQGPGGKALRDHGLLVADLRGRVAAHTNGASSDLDPDALAMLGIDLEAVRQATEAAFGPGALDPQPRRRPTGHMPFTKRAKKVLELSLREAVRLQDGHIGTGHILLGLIREGEGLGALVLTEMGLDLAGLRDEVTGLIESEAA
jgi:ATP-dependent Clp protease ATP-binding subunit ClpA